MQRQLSCGSFDDSYFFDGIISSKRKKKKIVVNLCKRRDIYDNEKPTTVEDHKKKTKINRAKQIFMFKQYMK